MRSAVMSSSGVGTVDDAASRARSRALALTLLTVAGLVLRLFFLSISDNWESDTFARVVLARRVVDQHLLAPSEVWLPGHFWVLAAPYALGLSGQVWQRLVTCLVGTAQIPLMYALGRRAFGTRAAFASAIILALSPLHIRLSVVSMSEVCFLTFLTLALWQFFVYVDDGSPVALCIGAVAMNLACAHRLEAWLFLPVLPAAILFRRQLGGSPASWLSLQRAVLFTALAGVFTGFWALRGVLEHGDLLHSANLTVEEIEQDQGFQSSSPLYTALFWPGVVLAALGPLLLVIVRVAWTAVRRATPARLPLLLVAAFLGVYYLQNIRSGLTTQARYGLLLVWLLAWAAGGLAGHSRWLADRRRLLALCGAWLIVVWAVAEAPLGIVSTKIASLSPRPVVNEPDVRSIESLLVASPPRFVVVGPLDGFYGSIMQRLDERYPRDAFRMTTDLGQAVALVGSTPSGVWIVGANTPVPAELQSGAGTAPIRVAAVGRYKVYRW